MLDFYLNLPKPYHQVFVKIYTMEHLLQVNLQSMATKIHVNNLSHTLNKIIINIKGKNALVKIQLN